MLPRSFPEHLNKISILCNTLELNCYQNLTVDNNMLIMYFITNIVNFARTKASSMNDALQFYFQTIIKCPILTLNYYGRRRQSVLCMYIHIALHSLSQGCCLYKHKVAHHKKRLLTSNYLFTYTKRNILQSVCSWKPPKRSGPVLFRTEYYNVFATFYKPSFLPANYNCLLDVALNAYMTYTYALYCAQ